MTGLTPEERELLATWDDGTYLCPRQRGVCNDRCAKQHQGLADAVESIVAAREDAAEKRGAVRALREAAEACDAHAWWRPFFAGWLRDLADQIKGGDRG